MKEIKINFEDIIVFIDLPFKDYFLFTYILNIRNSKILTKINYNVVIEEINFTDNFLSNIIKNKLNEKY